MQDLEHITQIGDRPLLTLALILLGLAVYGILFALRLRKAHLPASASLLSMLFGVILGAVLARLLYLLFNLNAELGHTGLAGVISDSPERYSLLGAFAGFVLGTVLALRLLRVKKRDRALVLFAMPLCALSVFFWLATLFLGNFFAFGEFPLLNFLEIPEGSLLDHFPLVMTDSWQMRWPAIATMEAVCALGCLIASLIRKPVPRVPGLLFEETIFSLCACHMFWELLYMRQFTFFFVHVDQVFCAITMLVLIVNSCTLVKRLQKKCPVRYLVLFIVGVVINGVTQYFMDKPYKFTQLLPEQAAMWADAHTGVISCVLLIASTILMTAVYRIMNRRIRRETNQD